MKRHKSIVDVSGRVVGVQYIGDDFDDEPPMLDPYFADNTLYDYRFYCHIGHPLGVKVIEHGVKASPNGYSIGHRDDPFKDFADRNEAIARIHDFDDCLQKDAPAKSVLEGREFAIKSVKIDVSNGRIYILIKCTDAVFQYLYKKWEFVLTGSADIDFINLNKKSDNSKVDVFDVRAVNLVIKGIAVYDAMNNNTQGQTISLVQYV